MAGESFTYDGSNFDLKMAVEFHTGTINNVLYPADSAGRTSGNDITIDYKAGKVPEYAMGGYGYSTSGNSLVENNRIELKQGTVGTGSTGRLVGGYSYVPSGNGNATANYNTATVSGGSVGGYVIGGESVSASGNATASHNTTTVGSVSVGDRVYGGRSQTASGNAIADYNTVTISGGLFNGNIQEIYGGYILYTGSEKKDVTLSASNNIVTITGGSLTGFITGAYIFNANNTSAIVTATNNTINLDGTATLDKLYGGVKFSPKNNNFDIFTGNTLNVRAVNSVKGIANFEYINFYLPGNLGNGGTLLEDGGSIINITNGIDDNHFFGNGKTDGDAKTTKIDISGLSGATSLKVGDEVVLLSISSERSSDPDLDKWESPQITTAPAGLTLDYTFSIPKGKDTDTEITARVTQIKVRPEAKAIAEGYLSGMAFLGQGSDFLLSQGMSAVQDASNDAIDGPQGFAAVGYGNVHHQTGSSVAVEGHHLIAGLTLGKRFSTSRLTTAAFLEYGNGDYDSANNFASGKIKGYGNTTYQGLGMLARSDFDNGMHVEGSVRAGEVTTDYRSNDLRDSLGKRAKYDTRNGYVGAHVGIGKTWTLTERDTFDVYTRGVWTRQGKDGTTLSTGERLEFDEIDSKRLQLGVRYEHTLDSGIQAYTGFAYDREYNGEAKVTTNGYRIDAPNLKGKTGIGEIGLKATPRPGQPFHLDFGLQGYTGKQEGITGSFRMRYFF